MAIDGILASAREKMRFQNGRHRVLAQCEFHAHAHTDAAPFFRTTTGSGCRLRGESGLETELCKEVSKYVTGLYGTTAWVRTVARLQPGR